MNKAGFLYLGAVMSLGSILLATSGCGDDTSGTGGSAGAGSSSVASTGSKGSGSSTGSGSGSSTGSAGGVTLDCASYCTQVAKNCTADLAQFGGPDAANSCKNTCASWAPGSLMDMDTNTLGCRIYHSGAPTVGAGATTHCGHAGLIGGDLDPAAGAAQCGDGVEAFCKLAVATCSAVWATEAACVTDAAKFAKSATNFSATKDTAGDTFSCRAYHLTVAAASTELAKTHCPHIAAVSTQCKAP
jgi:hypothetical protein